MVTSDGTPATNYAHNGIFWYVSNRCVIFFQESGGMFSITSSNAGCTAWNTAVALSTSGTDNPGNFAVWSDGTNIYRVFSLQDPGTAFYFSTGTISGTGISWSAETSISCSCFGMLAYVSITKDTSGHPWIITYQYSSDISHFALKAWEFTGGSWTLENTWDTSSTGFQYLQLVPLSSANLGLILGTGKLSLSKFNGATWSAFANTTNTYSAFNHGNFLGHGSSIYGTQVDSTRCYFLSYSSSWTEASVTGNGQSYCSLSSDGASNFALSWVATSTSLGIVESTNSGVSWTGNQTISGETASVAGVAQLWTMVSETPYIIWSDGANNVRIDIPAPISVTVTLTCKLLSVGATTKNFTYTGGSPSPNQGLCSKSGSTTVITINPLVTLKVTAPAATSTNRYLSNASFNNVNITIGSSSQSDTIYFYQQLNNTYRATPTFPTTWNHIYSLPAKGTVLGVATSTICTITTSNGGGAISCAGFGDNESAVSLPSSFNDYLVGSWVGGSPTSFTDTTGGNTHNVNYRLSNLTSNIVTVNWILGPMNTSVTINLVKQNIGTSVGAGNPIQASYFLNSNSTVNLVTGSNTFNVDKNTIVTVAGCSLESNTTIRWCLAGAIPFSFNASTGATETLGYWIQNNVSWRWVPPTACQNCGLQRPTVGFNSFGVLVPAFQLAAHGTGTNATNYAAAFMDNDTAWSTPNPFNYNLQPWVPNATSPVTVLAPKAFTITYSAGAGCVTSGDPFTAFICGDYVLGFFGVYGNDISTGWFLALILMAFDAYVWLKSNNPGLTLTVLFIEFSFFAVAGAGVGGSATNFLSSSVWQIALIFLTLFLSGSVYRLFVGRRDGG